MHRKSTVWFAGGACLLGLALLALPVSAERPAQVMPRPALDLPATGMQTAIFAGGCFWGIQGVFQHVEGVREAVSGYTGGSLPDPSYEQVSSGRTGHAEAVRVSFDPARVSYAQLLQLFFSVALDPTQVNRQGPDSGTQYRSALFVLGPEQDRVAHAYLAQLESAHVFDRPIATKVEPAGAFFVAEAYHQDYLERYPTDAYIAINDIPKVRSLQALFPQSYRARPATVASLGD